MSTNSKFSIPLVELFQKYVTDSAIGKRLQKNGKRVSPSTLKNYKMLLTNLNRFEVNSNLQFTINIRYQHNKKNFNSERKKYQRFYLKFTNFMYAKKCTDNYVGMLIKTLRSFFIYLEQIKGYCTGNFYKGFYICKDDTPVIVLNKQQLRFIIQSQEFDKSLPPNLKATKDLFVFGCTVGLRFSDIIALKVKNLEYIGDTIYLVTRSKKTNTGTRIKLPDYALSIVHHKQRNKFLFSSVSLNQFNKNLKIIFELAGWTYEVGKERSKKGQRKEIKKNGKSFRFCDFASSHIMRRTAITTMLMHGMPEHLVRKISGHAPNSKEFYKYVNYSESFMDMETDKVFEKLLET